MKLTKLVEEVDVEPMKIPDRLRIMGGKSWDTIPIENLSQESLSHYGEAFRIGLMTAARERRNIPNMPVDIPLKDEYLIPQGSPITVEGGL